MAEPVGKRLAISEESSFKIQQNFLIAILFASIFSGCGFFSYLLLNANPRLAVGTISLWCFIIPATIILIWPGFRLAKLLRGPRLFEVYQDGFILRRKRNSKIISAALWSEVTDIAYSKSLIDKERIARNLLAIGLSGPKKSRYSNIDSLYAFLNEEPDDRRTLYVFVHGKRLVLPISFSEPVYARTALGDTAINAWLTEMDQTGTAFHSGPIQVHADGIVIHDELVLWNWKPVAKQIDDKVIVSWSDPAQDQVKQVVLRLTERSHALLLYLAKKVQ